MMEAPKPKHKPKWTRNQKEQGSQHGWSIEGLKAFNGYVKMVQEDWAKQQCMDYKQALMEEK